MFILTSRFRMRLRIARMKTFNEEIQPKYIFLDDNDSKHNLQLFLYAYIKAKYFTLNGKSLNRSTFQEMFQYLSKKDKFRAEETPILL